LMIPVVVSVVNDGAFSPIKGIRKFLVTFFLRDWVILPICVRTFPNENMFKAYLNCLIIVISVKQAEGFLL